MTSWDSAQDDHLLLMFSEKMQWHTIATSLQQTGLVSGEEQLAALRAAWDTSLDIASACAFTICLGIAVDDTLHFVTRYNTK